MAFNVLGKRAREERKGPVACISDRCHGAHEAGQSKAPLEVMSSEEALEGGPGRGPAHSKQGLWLAAALLKGPACGAVRDSWSSKRWLTQASDGGQATVGLGHSGCGRHTIWVVGISINELIPIQQPGNITHCFPDISDTKNFSQDAIQEEDIFKTNTTKV